MSIVDYGTMRNSTSSTYLYLIVTCPDTGKVGWLGKSMHVPYWRWGSKKHFIYWLKNHRLWEFSPVNVFEGNV